ncbi:MAG TPA: hypothetical protein VGB24_07535 [Longimicrobium sp.]|jgi:hypothetical protein|uniref:hypothetical protein n=1 Tax=Longimicrobium sp. TaxID=2029185 RepID=UPI002ED8DC51
MLAIAATPSTASATAYPGFGTLVISHLFVPPLALVHLILLAYFADKRRYSSLRFALRHSCLAAVVPMLGVWMAMLELPDEIYTAEDRNQCLAILAAGALAAWLPVIAHLLQRTPPPTPPARPPA